MPLGWRRVDGEYCHVMLHPLPYPQVVEPRPDMTAAAVVAAIEEARALVREHGRDLLVWLAGPDHPWLAEALAQRGLRNEDSPGFEAVESAMALLEGPAGKHDLEVGLVDSYEAFAAGTRIEMDAFDIPAEGRAEMEAELERHWLEYTSEDNTIRRWNASIDGRVVGTAEGVLGEAGLNLFGGAVLAEARGKGVYRALVKARWDYSVQHGKPALTVQAGRMSRPVLEQLGFILIATIPIYVDNLSESAD